jgi:hypothetical protein
VNKLPDDKQLNIMWSVATSSAIESGTRPHVIFAKLLYNDLMNIKPPVGLYNENSRLQ